ncbi:hypothetical protein FRIGORI9N_280009 [Frigoribacterium sp. 9N]|nr:hypothetical protein FRIGORI9N_280009 [Frigoribacterium sp. 9N]
MGLVQHLPDKPGVKHPSSESEPGY